MRIFVTALALMALSFFVGVAGDLSTPPANAGQTVTLRIPPPIPADAPRAAPLPPLATSAALASPRAEPVMESARNEPKMLAEQAAAPLPKSDEAAQAKAKAREEERKQA